MLLFIAVILHNHLNKPPSFRTRFGTSSHNGETLKQVQGDVSFCLYMPNLITSHHYWYC